ncbi:MAG TPA: 2-keto-4-pentenoate hydratase [Clostridia bacterium]|nr:2-keto-4-pentenoate hydratase [Clostridia bacterium]
MALSDNIINEIAEQLLEAERTGIPIDPISKRYPGMDYEDAYKIQAKTIASKIEAGAVIVGRKIGLTSRAMQELVGLNEPDYGVVLHNKIRSEGQVISLDKMMYPRIEVEIGFYLKETLKGPGVTVIDVLAATEGVFPLLEVKDSRVKDPHNTSIFDSIADNSTTGIVVLGGKLTPVTEDIDLRLIGMTFEHNGRVIASATGSEVYGNPAEAVAWLANKLAEHGMSLNKGEFVMSGGMTKAIDVTPGSFFRATFDRLGSVSALF